MEIFGPRKTKETGEIVAEPKLPPTRRQLAHEAALHLEELVLNKSKINYRLAGARVVNSCRPDMMELYEHLKEINEIIKNERVIKPNDAFGEVRSYNVKSLMIKDNFFLPYDIIGFFCEQAIVLCASLAEGDNQTSGAVVHNTRVLTMQLATIREVCTALADCYPE